MRLDLTKSAVQKIFDPKVRIFVKFLDVKYAERLSPFKYETPKRRENSRFWASSDYTRHPIRTPYKKGLPIAVNDGQKGVKNHVASKRKHCNFTCLIFINQAKSDFFIIYKN